MPATRDPLSTWFDAAAVRFLERAYRNKGEWTGVYLAPPRLDQRARAAALGFYDLTAGRDRWGEVRWVRAFKRSVYWHLKKYGYYEGLRLGQPRGSEWAAVSVQWETGTRVLKRGWPSRRWAIRIKVHPGGSAASSAAARLPEADQWVGTARQSTVRDRDW